MRGYQRYIVKGLTHTTLMVTLSLTAIVWLMQALRLVDFIVNQGVSISAFLRLSLLLIPSVLMLILPVALFCAVVFFYHKLKVDSEMQVLQAVGLSRLQLAAPALGFSLIVVLIGYAISLYIMPISYREFRTTQFFLRNNYASVLLQEGVFATPTKGLMVYIRERADSGQLKGILVHDMRNEKAEITMMAESANMVETAAGPQFMLMHGNRQEMRDGKLSFLAFDSYPLSLASYTSDGNSRREDEREYFVTELFERGHSTSRSAGERQRSLAEAHQRVLWPSYALTLTAVALAMLLGGEFNRRQHLKRNMIAVGVACLLVFLSVTIRSNMAIYPAAVPLAYICLLVPFGFSLLSVMDSFIPHTKRT